MTFSCGEVRDRFEAYGSEALAAGERGAVREHLRSCEPCREEASAADPLFLFAGVGAGPVPADATAGVLAAVRAGIALKTAERRLEVPTARRRLGALASAAAAVALTLLVPAAPARRAPRDAVATQGGPAEELRAGVEQAPGRPSECGRHKDVPGGRDDLRPRLRRGRAARGLDRGSVARHLEIERLKD